jgi:hypothetical protein
LIQGFEYPTEPHQRRYGPAGYTNYESYRPWLRDEFLYRCVYCLNREKWCSDDVAFNIDHFLPVAIAPDLSCEYANLLYACGRCNRAKSDIVGIADPCQFAYGDCLVVTKAGLIEPLNKQGIKIADSLALNMKTRVEARCRWIRVLAGLRALMPDHYREYMEFPTVLDDLRPPRLRPPFNSIPDSVNDCFFVQREENRIASTY